MKKEIKTNDLNSKGNSLFSLNKILYNNYSTKIRKSIVKAKSNISQFSPIIPIRETLEENTSPKKEYSDKTYNKENDFTSKLKNFIKQTNSNSIASKNNSRKLKKENSFLLKNKNPFNRNQSKSTYSSTKKKNNIDFTDYGYYLTTNTVKQNDLETNTQDFNTIEHFDDEDSNSNHFKINLQKNADAEAKENQLNFKCSENSINQEISIADDKFLKEVIKREIINTKINYGLNADSLLNYSRPKESCSLFNKICVEERKGNFGRNNKNIFNTQLKTNVIDLNNSSEDKGFGIIRAKDSVRINKNLIDDYYNSRSNGKETFARSISLNKTRGNRDYSLNKNNVNYFIYINKNKTADKINNENENRSLMKKNPDEKLFTQKYNQSESGGYSITHVNKNKILKQNNNFFKINNSIERRKINLSKIITKSTRLKKSKSQTIKSDENSNKKIEINSSRAKNHVKITDEIIKSSFNSDFGNSNYEEKKSTKSIFYSNQSSKYSLSFFNSSESSYTDKFAGIVDKFKAFISKLISFISLDKHTNDNISLFKDASNKILNASFTNSKIDFAELSQKYCEYSKTDCAEFNILHLANSLERNIKFQIDDVLLGISPIILDCNIIKQEFMQSNYKSKKNLISPKLKNEELLQENLEEIATRSEQRKEKIKVIFQDINDNLNETCNFLVNEFGHNLNKNLEDFKMQDCEAIKKTIHKLNDYKCLSNSQSAITNNNCKIGFRDNRSKNHTLNIRKTSKLIEIDLSNDNSQFDKIINIVADNRKSLFDILQSEENSELSDKLNYMKTDINEKPISNILKAEKNKNKIIEEYSNLESSSDNSCGKIYFIT